MWTVSRDFTFEAAHALAHLPEWHKCRRLHGHSYRMRVEARATRLDSSGFVVDFAEIEQVVSPIVTRLDHRNLNDVFDFPTTSENIAAWIFHEIRKQLPSVIRVTLYETAETCVSFELPER